MSGPFRARRDRTMDVRLRDVEADAIRRVASDVAEAVAEVAMRDDPALRRLFPPAYQDDRERQAEFESLTRDELVAGKRRAAEAVLTSIDEGRRRRGTWSGRLDEETTGAWVRTINDARLILGTRLDVREDMPAETLSPEDPRAPVMNLYAYLSALLEALTEELGAQMPEGTD